MLIRRYSRLKYNTMLSETDKGFYLFEYMSPEAVQSFFDHSMIHQGGGSNTALLF